MSETEEVRVEFKREEEQGQRFPCRCDAIAGDALCFGCLHEENLNRESGAPWRGDDDE